MSAQRVTEAVLIAEKIFARRGDEASLFAQRQINIAEHDDARTFWRIIYEHCRLLMTV